MNNQSKPLVSVIVSFLNEERFLEEAIQSVLWQKYSNWELILIDDGSSDSSSDIAKKYAREYPDKIYYLEHENHANKGLSGSRNYGISKSKGDLIAILDADDVWLPDKLHVQVDILKIHPEVAVTCEASEYWYSWGDSPKKDKIINIVKDQDKVFYPPSLLKELYPLSTSAAPCPSSLMIRKAAMLKHGGFEEHFTGKYQLYEDQAFLHKIYLEEPVFISSLCNNKYRQRFGSLVQKIKQEGNYHVVRLYFLEWLEKYMQQKNIQDPAIHQLLKKAFKPYRSPILYRIQILPGQVLDSLRIFKQWLIKAFFL